MDRAISLPQQCSKSMPMLSVDRTLYSRISKSTECLSEEVPQPETSCMMVPESLSLEDIFANNQRLLNPSKDNERQSFKKKLANRLKNLKQ